MDTIKDIVYAITDGITNTHKMSVARMVKLLYLYDWSCVLNFGGIESKFEWSCGMCGPSSDQVINAISNDSQSYRTFYKDNRQGGEKLMIECIDRNYVPQLSEVSMKAVSHVVRVTKEHKWNDLVRLVSSTIPVVMSSMNEPLDLIRAAEIRRKMLGKI